ncbi:glycosyltransferase family 4 protein [Marivirga harenae]|uniref:glycosyltransferase family 4 protein n=1 Tax=Marivirga harenae TaxID=2010992 RepID=UPI0026DF7E23|nr:glycosyltransferase family 4 protein [Marivirga harenae]WKV13621.1 glycosyltransferase family 4 protein [Marivirga harenae]|tara:strand:- start:262823 stop:264046 length:1224 start_codon:yes stop_codon:yes gene_type:complete
MKILYIHQYFKTPDEGGANRSYFMAQALKAKGHNVEILTAHNEIKTISKKVDGLMVRYLAVRYENQFGFLKRIRAFLYFIHFCKRFILENHDYDKIIATSTPLTVGFIARWAKKKFHIPYIFEVRDLWPEAPIQMGVIKNPLLKLWLEKQELNFYQNAERVIALSPGMRNHIERRAPEVKVELIPNVADCDFFQRVEEKDEDLVLQFGVKNKFVVSYFGAVGPVNDLMSLIKCAELSAHLPIRFLIMGEGSSLLDVKDYVARNQLKNVFFIPYGTKEDVRDVMNVTDACYVSFLHKPVLRTNSPNKFFDAIASGKLIITNIQGWIRGLVEKRHIGFFADSDFPAEFGEKIKPFIDSPELLSKYQQASRDTAEQFFSRIELSNHFVQAIEGKNYQHEAEIRSIFSLSA